MAKPIVIKALRVQLVSLFELDQWQITPEPQSMDDAEALRRVLQRSPALAAAGVRAVDLLVQNGPYAIDPVLQILTEATKGLKQCQ
ncbi:MAG: hypothetical protein L0Z53_21480 [Acidobacteriales bacterium]|nr:hypothetical protein [Terriglobales bacterium]